MSEGMTCYERDEELCEDQMCLRVGCRLRNTRLLEEKCGQVTSSLHIHATDLVKLSATSPELVKQDAAVIHAAYTKLAIVLDALELVPARGRKVA